MGDMHDQIILLHEKIDRLEERMSGLKADLAVHADRHSALSWHFRFIYTTLIGFLLYIAKKFV